MGSMCTYDRQNIDPTLPKRIEFYKDYDYFTLSFTTNKLQSLQGNVLVFFVDQEILITKDNPHFSSIPQSQIKILNKILKPQRNYYISNKQECQLFKFSRIAVVFCPKKISQLEDRLSQFFQSLSQINAKTMVILQFTQELNIQTKYGFDCLLNSLNNVNYIVPQDITIRCLNNRSHQRINRHIFMKKCQKDN